MPLNSWQLQVVTESTVPPVVLIVLYFIGTMITIANYVAYVRYNAAVYGEDLLRTYLAFTIIGTAAFALVSAVSWLWAAKYVSTPSQRLQKTAIGLFAIFLFHDLPIFSMEWHMILCCGWRNPFQGFCFVKQIMLFLLSFTFGWLSYAYVASGYMNKLYGDPVPELKTGSEMVVVLPRAEVGFGSSAGFGDRALASPLLPKSPNVRSSTVDERGGLRWTDDGLRSTGSMEPLNPQPPIQPQPILRRASSQESLRERGSTYSGSNRIDPIALSSMHLMGQQPQQQQQQYFAGGGGSMRGGGGLRYQDDDAYSEPDDAFERGVGGSGGGGGGYGRTQQQQAYFSGGGYHDANPMFAGATASGYEGPGAGGGNYYAMRGDPFVPRGGGSMYVERHNI